MRILRLVPFLIVYMLLTTGNYSCKHDPVDESKNDTICFSRDILPIFQNSCGKTGCHDGNVEGFTATDYESIRRGITPGNANKSLAYKVTIRTYLNRMPPPPNAPLTADQRTIIAMWINAGATNLSCETTTSGNIQSDTVCFSTVILPILQSNCAVTGCHDPVTMKEELNLSAYNSIMSNNELVVPGQPSESKMIEVITKTSGEDRMPPYPRTRLTSTQIDQIKKWISDGAPNSICVNESCDTTGIISFSNKVWPIFRNNCVGCHNTSSQSGNINLNGYSNIIKVVNSGLLHGVLNQLPGSKAMPPYGTKLDECLIRTIEIWISQGALLN